MLDPPTNGTAFATNLIVASDGNFFADTNLNVANGIDIAVPGSIRFNNATSGTFTDLAADAGSIDVGNVNSGGYVSLVAGTSIDGGNVQAGGVIFRFGSAVNQPAELAVFDAAGRCVRHLVSGRVEAGDRTIAWDGRDDGGTRLASGVYFARFSVTDFRVTRKFLVMP